MMQIPPNESSWHGVGVEIQLFGPEPCLRHKTVVLRRRRGGQAPPHLRHKTLVQHIQDLHYTNLWFCVAGGGGHAPPPPATQNHRFASGCWGHLDLETCLTPEAKKWTDLNYSS